MLNELAYSALTDVILACLQAFAAGLMIRPDIEKWSAAWFWTITMILIAITFLLGALDHGFFEVSGHWLHEPLKVTTRICAVLTAWFICLCAAMQFLQASSRKKTYFISGALGLTVICTLFISDNFFIVMLAYSAAMLFMLILNIKGLNQGTASIPMILGILITFIASALPIAQIEAFAGFGIYATYHIALMPAVLCFYLGGLHLNRTPLLLKPHQK